MPEGRGIMSYSVEVSVTMMLEMEEEVSNIRPFAGDIVDELTRALKVGMWRHGYRGHFRADDGALRFRFVEPVDVKLKKRYGWDAPVEVVDNTRYFLEGIKRMFSQKSDAHNYLSKQLGIPVEDVLALCACEVDCTRELATKIARLLFMEFENVIGARECGEY